MWNFTFIIFITIQIFFISSSTKTTSNPIEIMDIQQIQTPNTIPVAVQVIPSYNKLDEPLIELQQHENTLNGNDGVTVSKNSIIFSELVEPAAVQSSLSTTIVSSKLDDEHIENKIPLIEPIVILEIPTKPESVTNEQPPKPSELINSPVVDINKEIDPTLAALLSQLTNTVFGTVIALDGQGSHGGHHHILHGHGHGNGNSHINSNLISHISANQNSIVHPIPNQQQNVTSKFTENIIIPLLKPIGINISEIENLQPSILVLLPEFSKTKQLRKHGNDKLKPIPENHLAHYSHNNGHTSNGEHSNGDDKGEPHQKPDISGLYGYGGGGGSAEVTAADAFIGQTFGWGQAGGQLSPKVTGLGGNFGVGAGAELDTKLLSASIGVSSGGTTGFGFSAPFSSNEGHHNDGSSNSGIFGFLEQFPAPFASISSSGGKPPTAASTSNEHAAAQLESQQSKKPEIIKEDPAAITAPAVSTGLFGLLTPFSTFSSSILSGSESEESSAESEEDEISNSSKPNTEKQNGVETERIPFLSEYFPTASGAIMGFFKPLTSLTGLSEGSINLSYGANLKPFFPIINKKFCPEALEVCIHSCKEVGKTGGVVVHGNHCYCSCPVPDKISGGNLCSHKYTSHCNKFCKTNHVLNYESGHCNSITGHCECKCPLGKSCFGMEGGRHHSHPSGHHQSKPQGHEEDKPKPQGDENISKPEGHEEKPNDQQQMQQQEQTITIIL